MNFRPRPYEEIVKARQASILAGEKVGIPKGTCYFCAWSLPKPALYCSGECAQSYMVERADLLKLHG